MRLHRTWTVIALAVAVMAGPVAAQTSGAADTIAPLPDSAPTRITTATAADAEIFTTHKAPAALPWSKPTAPAQAAPVATPFGNTAAPAMSGGMTKSPFAHAAPSGPVTPSAPHATEAVPVGNVDAVEVSEPAPPTPVAPEADPAKEDPAQPTEFTSPIFDATVDTGIPRAIVLRVLNKVTAQSVQLEAKPGETLKFGQLEITAVTCRISIPSSPRDDAGLMRIAEHLPGTRTIKPIFQGWMYASSPSVAALEHPIYDVTMVECLVAGPAAKAVDKVDKKKK